jgi:hypothetical protein
MMVLDEAISQGKGKWIMSLEDNPYVEQAEEGLRIRGGSVTDPRTNAILAVAHELNIVWRTMRELSEHPLSQQSRGQREISEKEEEM